MASQSTSTRLPSYHLWRPKDGRVRFTWIVRFLGRPHVSISNRKWSHLSWGIPILIQKTCFSDVQDQYPNEPMGIDDSISEHGHNGIIEMVWNSPFVRENDHIPIFLDTFPIQSNVDCCLPTSHWISGLIVNVPGHAILPVNILCDV